MRKIDIRLQPSRQLISCMITTSIISLFIVCYLPLYWILKFPLLTLVLGYSSYLVWHHGLRRTADAICGLRMIDQQWYLDTATDTMSGELRGDSTVTTLLSVLRFNVANNIISFVIFSDMLAPHRYR